MVLWSSAPAVLPGPLVPCLPHPVVFWLVLRSPGPLVSWSRASSVPGSFQLSATSVFCLLISLASWPGLRVRRSPGNPMPVPLVFWFSSPVVLGWSSGPLHASCRNSLVFWSLVLSFFGPLMSSRNCKLVSMGFVLVVRVCVGF